MPDLPAAGRGPLSRRAVRNGREEHDPDRAGARSAIRLRAVAAGRPAQDLHYTRDRTGHPTGGQCAAQDPGRTVPPRDVVTDLCPARPGSADYSVALPGRRLTPFAPRPDPGRPG